MGKEKVDRSFAVKGSWVRNEVVAFKGNKWVKIVLFCWDGRNYNKDNSVEKEIFVMHERGNNYKDNIQW